MSRKVLENDPKLYEKIETLASYGLSKKQIALSLGVSPSTLRAKSRDRQELNDAIDRGKASGLKCSGAALLREVENGDIPAIKWYEQTRHKMAAPEKADIEALRAEILELKAANALPAKTVEEITNDVLAKLDRNNE